jgi:hypothetical protein
LDSLVNSTRLQIVATNMYNYRWFLVQLMCMGDRTIIIPAEQQLFYFCYHYHYHVIPPPSASLVASLGGLLVRRFAHIHAPPLHNNNYNY